MAWLGLLALMLLISAAPGISLYLDHLRAVAAEPVEGIGEGPQPTA
jgi:hypothetical protein